MGDLAILAQVAILSREVGIELFTQVNRLYSSVHGSKTAPFSYMMNIGIEGDGPTIFCRFLKLWLAPSLVAHRHRRRVRSRLHDFLSH